MNILIACEESQVVCKAFRDKGHNAFSCDLQFPSGGLEQYHILGNVLDILEPINGKIDFITLTGESYSLSNWDMIIAFPPCTYFSRVNAFNYFRNGVFNQKRFDASKTCVDLFLTIFNCSCPKICIENPVPIFLFDNILPKYSMVLEPYEYGHPFSKKTCLWLKGLPYLLPTVIASSYTPYVKINGNLINGKLDKKERSKFRSKTFLGVAKAMADQWG